MKKFLSWILTPIKSFLKQNTYSILKEDVFNLKMYIKAYCKYSFLFCKSLIIYIIEWIYYIYNRMSNFIIKFTDKFLFFYKIKSVILKAHFLLFIIKYKFKIKNILYDIRLSILFSWVIFKWTLKYESINHSISRLLLGPALAYITISTMDLAMQRYIFKSYSGWGYWALVEYDWQDIRKEWLDRLIPNFRDHVEQISVCYDWHPTHWYNNIFLLVFLTILCVWGFFSRHVRRDFETNTNIYMAIWLVVIVVDSSSTWELTFKYAHLNYYGTFHISMWSLALWNCAVEWMDDMEEETEDDDLYNEDWDYDRQFNEDQISLLLLKSKRVKWIDAASLFAATEDNGLFIMRTDDVYILTEWTTGLHTFYIPYIDYDAPKPNFKAKEFKELAKLDFVIESEVPAFDPYKGHELDEETAQFIRDYEEVVEDIDPEYKAEYEILRNQNVELADVDEAVAGFMVDDILIDRLAFEEVVDPEMAEDSESELLMRLELSHREREKKTNEVVEVPPLPPKKYMKWSEDTSEFGFIRWFERGFSLHKVMCKLAIKKNNYPITKRIRRFLLNVILKTYIFTLKSRKPPIKLITHTFSYKLKKNYYVRHYFIYKLNWIKYKLNKFIFYNKLIDKLVGKFWWFRLKFKIVHKWSFWKIKYYKIKLILRRMWRVIRPLVTIDTRSIKSNIWNWYLTKWWWFNTRRMWGMAIRGLGRVEFWGGFNRAFNLFWSDISSWKRFWNWWYERIRYPVKLLIFTFKPLFVSRRVWVVGPYSVYDPYYNINTSLRYTKVGPSGLVFIGDFIKPKIRKGIYLTMFLKHKKKKKNRLHTLKNKKFFILLASKRLF